MVVSTYTPDPSWELKDHLPCMCRYYGIKGSRFSDRVFTFMDKDGSGKLDFKEFLLGVWNYSTYSSRQIARVAFSFFDVDKKGVIDMVRHTHHWLPS